MASTSNDEELDWYSIGTWSRQYIVCQQVQQSFQQENIFSQNAQKMTYPSGSHMSMVLLTLSVILCVTTTTLYLLKPLRMPFTAQMIGGILVIGSLYSLLNKHSLVFIPYIVVYALKTISFLGFILHSLVLGVETNMTSLIKRMNRKSAIIGFSGFFLSLILSLIPLLFFFSVKARESIPQGYFRIVFLNAQTYFLVTCNHVNDLGISNSELGRLACTISLFLDISSMVLTFILFELIPPLIDHSPEKLLKPLSVIGFYVVLFFGVRPYFLRIIDQCSMESKKQMKVRHLATIVVTVMLIAGIGESLGQMFAVFLFALSLPEDPLSSLLSKKLDAITFGLFFPLYCAMQGEQTDVFHLDSATANRIESNLIFGSVGKFLGTCLSSMTLGLPLNKALALSLIMSCKGLLDIVSLGLWATSKMIDWQECTVATFHFLICSGALLPIVRCLYKPSSEYSNILGTSVMDICENGSLKTMACIHKEDNIPGIVRLIEAFDPSRSRPIALIVLQLIQLTGRVSLPILGLLDQVKSSGILGQKLTRCEQIVESLSHLERITKGYVRMQHFISLASYDTMHNDVCNLAYERDINLLILPFHVSSSGNNNDRNSEGGSTSAIRSLNKMIVENAPCAVGLLIDRSKLHLSISMTQVYRIAIIYIGGMDDREAIAYTNLFATNPSISVMITCLKSTLRPSDDFDSELIDEIRAKIKTNERLSFDEVIVQDGAETTDYLVSINKDVDFVVAGRCHDANCGPLFGLGDVWTEYPELGILGDLLASTDFQFSVLVVHSSVEVDQM